MNITTATASTGVEMDKLRHDFKGNLRKVKVIYDLLDEQIKNEKGIDPNYATELEKTIMILLEQWQKLRSKVIS